MKTNIGIETTDDERLLIGNTLGTGKMVSRKELTAEVQRHVASLIAGETSQSTADEAPADPFRHEPPPERDRSVRGFVPSRGDEDYLLKTHDPELKEILSRLLDVTEELDAYTWKQLEKIRVGD